MFKKARVALVALVLSVTVYANRGEPIAAGETKAGWLDPYGEVWHLFTGSAGDVVSILALGFDGLDTGVELYREDSSRGLVLVASDSGAMDSYLDDVVLQGSNYSIRVFDEMGSGGTYSLHLSFATPQPFVLGDRVVGNIDEQGDDRIYQFDAQAGDQITVAVESPGGAPFSANLYAPDGTLLLTDNNFEGGDPNGVLFTTVLPNAGTYRVLIDTETYASTGPFSLLISQVSVFAQSISPGAIFTGELYPGWLRSFDFTASAGQVVSIEVVSGGNLDTDATLIRKSDRFRVATATAGNDSRMNNVRIPSDDVYTIEIHTGASNGGITCGTFTLFLSDFTTPPLAIRPRERLFECIAPIADDDRFAFTGFAGAEFTIEVQPFDTFELEFTVYDPDGSAVLVDNNHEGGVQGGALSTFTTLKDGTYTVLVDSEFERGEGFYSIVVYTADPTTSAITPGGSASGELRPGEEILYHFNLPSDSYLSVSCKLMRSYARVQLLDSGSNVVSEVEGRDFLLIDDIALSKGDYTVRLSDAVGATPFALYLSDAEMPSILPLGDSRTGAISRPADDDLYRLNLSAGDELILSISSSEDSDTLEVSLYDPNGALIEQRTVGSELVIQYTVVTGGLHTVLIDSESGMGYGGYSIYGNIASNLVGSILPGGMACFRVKPGEVLRLSFSGFAGVPCSIYAESKDESSLVLQLRENTTQFSVFGPMGSSSLIDDQLLPVDGVYEIAVTTNEEDTVCVYLSDFTQQPERLDNLPRRTGGFLNNPGADRFFEIPLTQGDLVSIVAGGGVDISLYDPAGMLVQESPGVDPASMSIVAPADGDYLLLVDCPGGPAQFVLSVGGVLDKGTTITGAVEVYDKLETGETHTYRFDALGGQFISAVLVPVTGFTPLLELKRGGNVLVSSRAGSPAVIDDFVIPADDTYELVVSSGSGAYALYVSDYDAPSTSINPGENISFSIAPPADDDLFSFSATSGESFVLVLRRKGEAGLNLRVFDPLDRQMLNVEQSDTDATYALTAIQDGEYTVLVDSAEPDASTGAELELYRTALVRKPLVDRAVGELDPGTTVVYEFQGNAGQIFSAFAGCSSSLYLSLWRDGLEILRTPEEESAEIDNLFLQDGSYELKVSSSYEGTIEYALITSLVSPSIVSPPVIEAVFVSAGADVAFRFTHMGGTPSIKLTEHAGGAMKMSLYDTSGTRLWDSSSGPPPDIQPADLVLIVEGLGPFDWGFAELLINTGVGPQPTAPGWINEGQTLTFPLDVAPQEERGSFVIGAVGAGIELHLLLRDPNGVARYSSPIAPQPVIRAARLTQGRWTIELRAVQGNGAYALAISRPPIPVALQSRGYAFFRSPFDQAVFTFDRTIGERVLLYIEGGCNAELFDPDGRRLLLLPGVVWEQKLRSLLLPQDGTYTLKLTAFDSGLASVSIERERTRTVRFGEHRLLWLGRATETLELTANPSHIGKNFRVVAFGEAELWVESPTGEVLGETRLSSEGAIEDIPIESAGAYLIKLEGNGPILIGVSDTPEETARQIDVGRCVHSSLSPPGDEDIYTFTAEAGSLKIDVRSRESLAPVIELYDERGAKIISALASQVLASLPSAGTYTLIIKDRGVQTGWYGILLHQWRTEALNFGSVFQEYFDPMERIDKRYRVSVNAQDRGKLCLFRLYDSGQALNFTVDSPGGRLPVDYRNGTWVAGPIALQPGDYNLNVASSDVVSFYLGAVSSLPTTSASAMTLGQEVNGVIRSLADDQLFYWDASGGEKVGLELYSPAELIVVTPSGEVWLPGEETSFTAESGRYYFIVSPTGIETGAYRLLFFLTEGEGGQIGFGDERLLQLPPEGRIRFQLDVAPALVGKTFSCSVRNWETDTRVNVLLPSGGLAGTASWWGGYNLDDILLSESGVWTVEVENRDETPGTVLLGISTLPLLTPTVLPLASTLQGILDTIGDERQFLIPCNAGDRLVVEALAYAGLDTDLLLYGPGGGLLAVWRQGSDSRLEGVVVPSAGNCLVHLKSASATKGAYTLSVRLSEPNEAFAMDFGSEITSQLSDTNPADEFIVNVAPGTIGRFHIRALARPGEVSLEMYDPSGTLLGTTSHSTLPLLDLPIGGGGAYRIVARRAGTGELAYRMGLSDLPIEGVQAFPGEVEDSIDTVADQDGWSFNGTAGEEFSIEVVPHDSLNPTIELLGPSGELVASAVGMSSACIEGLILPKTGTYQIIVRAVDGSMGLYTLRAKKMTMETLSYGQSVVGELEYDGDTKEFQLEGVSAGDRLSIVCRTLSSDFDLWLIAPSGRVEWAELYGSDAVIRGQTAEESGTYRVQVTGTAGVFELGVSDAPVDTPMPVVAGGSYNGDINPLGDEDLFTFSASAGDYISIMARGLSLDDTPQIELYSPTGNLVAKAVFVPEIPNFLASVTGTYTLILHGGAGVGSYDLLIMSGNPPAGGMPLPHGTAVTGLLPPNGEQFYEFSVPSHSFVSLLLDSSPAIELELYGPSGEWIDYDITSSPAHLDENWLEYPGAYLVHLKSDSPDSVPYTLWLSNGSQATSQQLNDGDVVPSSFNFEGEDKLFTFNAQQGDEVFFVLSGLLLGCELRVRSSKGEHPVAYDLMPSGDEVFSLTALRTDTYTVVVDAFDPMETGDFTLQFEIGRETFQPINSSDRFTATLAKGDVASYQFSATRGEIVSALVSSSDGSDLIVSLETESGWEIARQSGDIVFLDDVFLPTSTTYNLSVLSAVSDPDISVYFWKSSGSVIAQNTAYPVSVAQNGEDSVMLFNASAGQEIVFMVEYVSGDGASLTLFAPSGESLPADMVSIDGVPAYQFYATTDGTYTSVVDAVNAGAGNFTVWLFIEDTSAVLPGGMSYAGGVFYGDELLLRFPVGVGYLSATAVGDVNFELSLPQGENLPSIRYPQGAHLPLTSCELSGTCKVLVRATTPSDSPTNFQLYLYDTSQIDPAALTEGNETPAEFTTEGQLHTYELNLNAPGSNFLFLSSGFDIRLLIFDPSGKPLRIQTRSFSPSLIAEFDAPVGGLYTLIATPASPFQTGSYSILWTSNSQPGIRLNYGDTYTGTLPPASTRVFSFNGSEGDIISLELTPSSLFDLELISPLGFDAPSSETASSILIDDFPLPITGLYTVLVRERADMGGQFTLGLSDFPSEAPTQLLDGSQYSGTIRPLADDDAFIYNANAGDVLVFENVTGAVSIQLYSPLGEPLGVVYPDSEFELPDSGQYTILVDANNGGSSINYSFTFYHGSRTTLSATPGTLQTFAMGEYDEVLLSFSGVDGILSAQIYPEAGATASVQLLDNLFNLVATDSGWVDDVPVTSGRNYWLRLFSEGGSGNVSVALSLKPFLTGGGFSARSASGTLDRAEDFLLALDLLAGQLLSVSATSSLSLSATLFDESLSRVLSDVPVTGETLTHSIRRSGIHYLLIDSTEPGQAGDYTLNIVKGTPTTDSLAYGQTRSASLSEGDSIAYEFDGQTNDVVSIAVLPVAPLEVSLSLYAPSGALLGYEEGSTIDDIILPETGVYRAIVAELNRTSGSFRIALSGTTLPAPLPLNSELQQTLSPEADDALFSFDGREGWFISVETRSNFDLQLTLYSPDGSPFLENTSSITSLRLPLTGKYLLIVDAVDPAMTGDFMIKLTRFPPTFFTEEAGNLGLELDRTGGKWCAIADYDRDDHPDIVLIDGNGALRLFRNTPVGFVETTATAGVATDRATCAVWGDFDNDGYPDLYVTRRSNNRLYHNLGNGTFSDVADKLGVAGDARSKFSAWTDFNLDGYIDLFLADSSEDHLFLFNPSTSVFNEVMSQPQSTPTSAVTFIDINSDRYPDLLKLKCDGTAELYENKLGRKLVSHSLTTSTPAQAQLTGTTFALWGDFNGSGLPELVVNGSIYQLSSDFSLSLLGTIPSALRAVAGDFDNDGDSDLFLTDASGGQLLLYTPLFEAHSDSGTGDAPGIRSLALIDYDSDGALDIFAVGQDRNYLFHNISASGGFVRLSLNGRYTNRSGIGCRATSTHNTTERQAWVGQTSTSGQNPSLFHFGLGSSSTVDIFIHWTSGVVSYLSALPSGSVERVTEPEPPQVVSTDPPDGAVVRELPSPTPHIAVNMEDPFGIEELATKVGITVDGVPFTAFTLASPSEGVLHILIPNPPAGVYELHIVPVNIFSVNGSARTVSFRLDNLPPSVLGTKPRDGSSVKSLNSLLIYLQDDYSPDERATRITVEKDGNIFTDYTLSYPSAGVVQLDISNPADGVYIFTIIPVDALGNVGLPRTVRIIDTAPLFSSRLSEIFADPGSIFADGVSTSRIVLVPRNELGGKMGPGLDVTMQSTAGTLSSVRDLGDGTYLSTLRSGTTPGRAVVTAQVNLSTGAGAPVTVSSWTTVDFIPQLTYFDLAGIEGAGQKIVSVSAFDLDDDGADELAVAMGNKVIVFSNDGFGALKPSETFNFGEEVRKVLAFDYDSDSDFDLLLLTATRLILLPCTRSFGPPVELRVPLLIDPVDADAGDIDNDGDIDLGVVGSGGEVLILLNSPTGFDYRTLSTGRTLKAIAFGDFDSDGDFDAVVAGSIIALVFQNGSTFSYQIIRQNSEESFSCVVPLDINQDGYLDIFAGGNRQDILLPGPDFTSGGLSPGETYSEVLGSTLNTLSAISADYDDDGTPDLILGTKLGLRILLNKGGLVDYSASAPSYRSPVYSLDSCDADGDGDTDAFLGGESLYALLNLTPRIWFLSPNGTLAGEDALVRIYGNDFAGTPRVYFGKSQSPQTKRVDRGLVEAVAPPLSQRTVSVRLINDDGRGRKARLNDAFHYTPLQTFQLTTPGGTTPDFYRMIGIPLYLADYRQLALPTNLGPYNRAEWRMFAYLHRRYTEYPRIGLPAPTRGFWFISAVPRTLSFIGGAPTPPLHIPLEKGWNIVCSGLPYPVALGDLKVSDGRKTVAFLDDENILTGKLVFGYNPSKASYYSRARSLQPGVAYWFYRRSKRGVVLIVGEPSIKPRMRPLKKHHRRKKRWKKPPLPPGVKKRRRK